LKTTKLSAPLEKIPKASGTRYLTETKMLSSSVKRNVILAFAVRLKQPELEGSRLQFGAGGVTMKKVLVLFAVLLMPGMGLAYGQDQQSSPPDNPSVDNQSQPADQPGGPTDQPGAPSNRSNDDQNAPGVARLSYIHGKVSMQRGDNGEWVGVTLNTPIMAGDRVSTGDDSKAELQLDWADVVRLSSNTTVKVANITNNNIQVQVGQGLVTYSVLQGAQAASEIDTPNAAVKPSAIGEYRIQVNSNGESIMVVRSGGADASTPQGSTHVDSGQMITVEGAENPQYKIDPAPATDNWDAWNNDRNRIISRAEEAGNTNRREVGTQDLDAYGRWENVPDYGQVWVPNEGPGWAPYQDGRWLWEPYYGWTWMGYEPWGWAPYHYGRWFLYNDAWAWWPGPIYPAYYPLWAPAYVSFFGWGGGWGFGFGFGFGWGFGLGHIGWLACGPGDWYHPWWGPWGARMDFGRFDRINGIHEGFRPLAARGYSNFDHAFTNARLRDGISSMDGRDFGRTAVPRNEARISEATLRNASMTAGRMPVSPSRASYSPTGRAADPRSYSHAPSASQHFFTASRANASRNTFAARGNTNISRGNASSNTGNRGGNSFSRPSSTLNARTNAHTGSSGAITSSRPGWRTFTPPSSAGRGNESQANRNSFNSANRGSYGNAERGGQTAGNRGAGWDRFTPPASGSRGYSNAYGGGSRGYYGRPSLNMRQPIVQPRSGYGYGGARPAYNAPRGYNAPRSSGRGFSTPRSGGSRAGSGGGSRGGFGGGHAGGGGHGGGGHGR
jgi:FecR protein